MRIKNIALAGALSLAFGNAQAALHDRGGGLIYDDVLNVTWLQDASYAATQFAATGGAQGDEDGLMEWSLANSWAANLSHGGFDDWRLPTALNQDGSGPCSSVSNCTSSEMGHMFYTNMGASAGSILTGTNTANLALFTNLQHYIYWSGTAYAPNPANFAWYFNIRFGYQGFDPQRNEFYAWAVRDGDVAAPVPEPETYAMLLVGLGLIGVVSRRRKQKLNA